MHGPAAGDDQEAVQHDGGIGRPLQTVVLRGDGRRLPVELDSLAGHYSDDELIETDSVLNALAAEDPDAAGLVRLHVFGGLSIEDATGDPSKPLYDLPLAIERVRAARKATSLP